MGRAGFFVPCQSHPIPSAILAMHGTYTPHKSHANPIKKVSPFYVIYIQYIFIYISSLGGASRPPVYPPGTAAHGRVLARSASEAGAERQRSGSRRVQRGTPRSRTTREHIRDTHGTCRGRTGHQQPLTPRCSPLTACRAIPRGTWRGAPPTPLQAPMHSVPCHAPLRARARGTPLQAPMHSVLCPAPLRARARGTPLQAPMHSALCPTPLRAPKIALHSAGVSRLKITPAFAGAMRMSAKPPLRLPWRGLSPRGRDTPASLKAGRARARPGRGAPLRRAQHYAHGHLPLRFGGTRAPLRMARHYAHGHIPLRGGSTPPCSTWNSTTDW